MLTDAQKHFVELEKKKAEVRLKLEAAGNTAALTKFMDKVGDK